MPLEDAIPFLSRNFDQFVEMMKKKIATINAWVPPDERVRYLLNLLLDGKHLKIPELEEINKYTVLAMNKLSEVEQPEKKFSDSPGKSRSMDRNGEDILSKFGIGREESRGRSERSSLLPPPRQEMSSPGTPFLLST